ncbi:MAG: M1 family metallopeptidase [Flavobacteriaceae bacterium]
MNRILLLLLFCFQVVMAQQTDYVDFKTAKIDLGFKPDSTKVFGFVRYDFKILKPADSIFIDAQNMTFAQVELNGKKANFSNDKKKLWIKYRFKPDKTYTVSFRYEAKPQKALYFIDWGIEGGNQQIWTQGQGKYTSNWLPSFDDMSEKVEFDLSITFNKNYQVIANGKLTKKEVNTSTATWHYNMQQPMSSYLVALAIGKYKSEETYSKSGIPLSLYYYPEDSLKVEPTYRYTKTMFDYLENEIGVPYPWQNYKQIPVKDFLYAGMENTGTTIFADGFVIDSIAFTDKNYVNVNAHELAHQWFGNLVTETSGAHHWLQEGFATYYALLAERDIFGGNHYYWQLYEYAQELLNQDKMGGGTALLNPKSSSATFYKRGAWVLHKLRERVGDEAFKTAVKNYLKKHKFKNVETNDFIGEVEKTSGQNLNDFVDVWLNAVEFPYDLALESLKKSAFIQEYLMADCEASPSKCRNYLSSGISNEAKIKIVAQAVGHLAPDDFKNSLKVRQAIAKNLREIPLELKPEYETLLNEASYLTKEIALYNLWVNFPNDRKIYLSQAKNIEGFPDKNIKMLWLALALITNDFETGNKSRYYNELIGYTSPKYGFEIRQNAFRYLHSIKACNDLCEKNLNQAANHHNWRFSKFAKEMLQEMAKE